nr:hypothetical protein [Nanoarchaeum sp.]
FVLFYDKDSPVSPGTKTDSTSTLTPAVAINYDNLDDYMSRNAIINDLPEDATILLKFYNFDSGAREWEKSFVVTRSKVYEGSVDNADLVVSLHSKYLAEWNSRNFCTIMTKANNNGDLGYETGMSTVSLAWKYKNLMKYKECFGE